MPLHIVSHYLHITSSHWSRITLVHITEKSYSNTVDQQLVMWSCLTLYIFLSKKESRSHCFEVLMLEQLRCIVSRLPTLKTGLRNDVYGRENIWCTVKSEGHTMGSCPNNLLTIELNLWILSGWTKLRLVTLVVFWKRSNHILWQEIQRCIVQSQHATCNTRSKRCLLLVRPTENHTASYSKSVLIHTGWFLADFSYDLRNHSMVWFLRSYDFLAIQPIL